MKRKFILGFFVCILAIWLTGCWSQLGETAAEGKRRHMRNLRVSQQELMDDIDTIFMTDQPSKLSDKRIP